MTPHKIGWHTAAGLVIASMVGTGVFTSLGFQVLSAQNTWSIVLLWSIGGVMAFIGAMIYAELGAYFKVSGGDYIFLSRLLHPSLGYLYGWISLTVGFPAPIAISAMAIVAYWQPIFGYEVSLFCAIAAIICVSILHSVSVKQSALFQNLLTLLKLAFALGLVAVGIYYIPAVANSSLDFGLGWKNEIIKPGFAVSLIFVFYAYTGWNSAAYIVGELDQPKRNLPLALLVATGFVAILYVLIQLVFLKHATIGQLEGNVEVATIAIGNLFGEKGIYWVSFLIGLQLLATISGYTWVAPRVTRAMALEYTIWKPLSKVNKYQIPVRSTWVNSIISILLIFSGSFEAVMLYAGFVLQLMGTITIAASLRLHSKEGFRTPWKPWLHYLYISFSIWVMGFMIYDRPTESLFGVGIILLGFVIFLLDKPIDPIKQSV